jgi:LacI family transcriptional regulator
MRSRPTIIHVAKESGLSKATVSRVLNQQTDISVRKETRLRVQSAAELLGYVPNKLAASLRSNRTNNIAISISDISNPFFPELVRGAQDTLSKRGYNMIIFNNDWDKETEREQFNVIKKTLVDGVILSPSSLDLDLSCLGTIPVIILGNSNAYPSFDSIGNNSRAGVELAFERLYSLKHRRIGLVFGGSAKLETSKWRLEIYRDFHQRHGVRLDENLVARCKFTVRASDSFIMARDPIERLLKLERRPTAIFASNDILALSVLQVANELGIAVPDELSVIGMDDVFAASTSSPPLTTICKQRYKLGELAAERLLDLLSCPGTVAQKTPLRVRLACKLIERGTTSSL